MLIIPIQPTPAQIVNALLADQATTIVLRQMNAGLFMDVYVDDALIVGGVIAQNNNRIVRDLWLGFTGDFAFEDTQPDQVSGPADPFYTGLGTRFVLGYFRPDELPPLFGQST